MKIELIDKAGVIGIIESYLLDCLGDGTDEANKEYVKGYIEALKRILDEVHSI